MEIALFEKNNMNKIYSIKTFLKTKTHTQDPLYILQMYVHIKDITKHTRDGLIRGGEQKLSSEKKRKYK